MRGEQHPGPLGRRAGVGHPSRRWRRAPGCPRPGCARRARPRRRRKPAASSVGARCSVAECRDHASVALLHRPLVERPQPGLEVHDADARRGARPGATQRRGVGVTEHEYDVGPVRVEVGVGMGQDRADALALVAIEHPRGVGCAAQLGEQVGVAAADRCAGRWRRSGRACPAARSAATTGASLMTSGRVPTATVIVSAALTLRTPRRRTGSS